jgi:hypothetical protein
MTKRAVTGRIAALAVFVGGTLVSISDDAAAERQAEAGAVEAANEAARPRRSRDDDTTRSFKLLGKNAIWQHVQTVSIPWATFHTQGLVKVGDVFFVSAVEVLEPRIPNGTQTDTLYDFSIDRSPGAGRGWLFKFDAAGALLGKVELTAGDVYHPGGIDFDGRDIWVPVCEYRPNSRSNIYRVNPETLDAELVFSEADAIGGIVRNRHGGTLHGVSWGSRRIWTWELEPGHKRLDPRVATPGTWEPNPQFYVDYQDCHYHGVELMLCAGVASYATPRGSIAFGGLDLVDLRKGRMEHQVPVNLFIDEGAGPNPSLSLAHNAFWVEPSADGGSLRFYFMTESDNQADLLVYQATPWINR